LPKLSDSTGVNSLIQVMNQMEALEIRPKVKGISRECQVIFMVLAKLREKVNRYIATWASIVAILVLLVFLVVQFITYREILYSDLVCLAKLETDILARTLAGFQEAKQPGFKISKDIEEKLKAEIKSISAEHTGIVKMRILEYDSRAGNWHEVYSLNGGFKYVLSDVEKKIAVFGSSFFLRGQEVWFNGEGFVTHSAAAIDTPDNTKLRVSIDIDANYYIKQQILISVLLFLFLTGIGIILVLQYRLLFLKLYKPLDNLIDGMKLISRGQMDYKVPVIHRDELGRFIESFNEMVAELKKAREDLTHELDVTREQKEKIFNIYRDVVYAVTQGKFLLVRDNELPGYVNEGDSLAEVAISKNEDVVLARNTFRQVMDKLFPNHKRGHKVLLCISEAATNIIKHAGNGIFTIKKMDDDCIRFVFADQGPGMDFDHLPSMLFFRGFSTEISLGCGFKLIYSIVDRIILSTSENGTTVIFDIMFCDKASDYGKNTALKQA